MCHPRDNTCFTHDTEVNESVLMSLISHTGQEEKIVSLHYNISVLMMLRKNRTGDLFPMHNMFISTCI